MKLAQIEPEVSSASREPAYMTNEELLAHVQGAFQKIADELPYILELRARFARQKRGSPSICGCRSWEEFCTKHLHRTSRRIRQVIAAYTNDDERAGTQAKDSGIEKKPKPDSLAALNAAMEELDITSTALKSAAAKHQIPVEWILKRLSPRGSCWSPVKQASGQSRWAFDEQAVLVRLFRDWELGVEKEWPNNRDLTPVIRKAYAFATYLEGIQKVRAAQLREQVQAVGVIVQVGAR